jgi:hypothetical protein
MKPDREGIWEWFDEDGNRRLVEVFDVMKKIPGHKPYLRVYWWGGYYNVNDEVDDLYNCKGEVVEKDVVDEAEWTDNWGDRVGDNQSLPEDQLYLMPTPDELALFREKDKQ